MFPIIKIISPKSSLVLKNKYTFFSKMRIFLLITKTVHIYLENFSSTNNYKK